MTTGKKRSGLKEVSYSTVTTKYVSLLYHLNKTRLVV
jgi:hypothetical protein